MMIDIIVGVLLIMQIILIVFIIFLNLGGMK